MPMYTKPKKTATGSVIGDNIKAYLDTRKAIAEIDKLNREESSTPSIKDQIFASMAQQLGILPSAGGAPTTQPTQPGQGTQRQILDASTKAQIDSGRPPINLDPRLAQQDLGYGTKESLYASLGQKPNPLMFEVAKANIGVEETLKKQQALLPGEIQKAEEMAEVEVNKQVASQKGKALEVEERSAEKGMGTLGRLFQRSQDIRAELGEKYPGFNEPGIGGVASRKYVELKNKITQDDVKLGAYMKRLDRTAFQMARDIEGGRVTDKDVRIVLNTLLNPLGASQEQDLWNASWEIEDWEGRGAKGKAVDELKAMVNQQLAKVELKKRGKA